MSAIKAERRRRDSKSDIVPQPNRELTITHVIAKNKNSNEFTEEESELRSTLISIVNSSSSSSLKRDAEDDLRELWRRQRQRCNFVNKYTAPSSGYVANTPTSFQMNDSDDLSSEL